MIYRIHNKLSAKKDEIIYPNSLHRLSWLDEKQIETLIETGSISRISPPPLSILPGWKARSIKLLKIRIVNAEEFLEGNVNEMSKILRVKIETIKKWKQELEDKWLTHQLKLS